MEIEGERHVPLWRPRRRRGEEVGERGDEVSRVRGAVDGGVAPRGRWQWPLAGRSGTGRRGAARGEEDLRCGRDGG
jgi:hypothetical protein